MIVRNSIDWLHVPASLGSDHVKRFARTLSGRPPVRVPVRPDLLFGAGPAIPGQCYRYAEEYAAMCGGRFQHGWAVMEVPDLYLRAFHHAVVASGDSLVDVSPPVGTYKSILFVPTAGPGMIDEHYDTCHPGNEPGSGVPCKYHPLGNSAAVRRIVQAHMLKDRLPRLSPEWWDSLEVIGDLEFRARHHADLLRARRIRSRRKRA